jgi:hypothetical protein
VAPPKFSFHFHINSKYPPAEAARRDFNGRRFRIPNFDVVWSRAGPRDLRSQQSNGKSNECFPKTQISHLKRARPLSMVFQCRLLFHIHLDDLYGIHIIEQEI